MEGMMERPTESQLEPGAAKEWCTADDGDSSGPPKRKRLCDGSELSDGRRNLAVRGYQPPARESTYNGIELKPCFVKVFAIADEVLVKHGCVPDKKVDLETLKRGLFSCSNCSYRTDSLRDLRQHVKTHDYVRDFHKCTLCGFKANWDTGLSTHMKAVHLKQMPHKCPHCEYRTAFSQALKSHVLRHTGEMPYSCKECDFTAMTASTMKVHIRTHSGDKPYVCPHCPYRARQYPHLKSHLFVHLDLKPYSCEKCDFKTRQSSHLRTHIKRVHNNERPFHLKCDHCDYTAKTKQSLDIHVSCKHTNEEPFVCKECPFKSAHQAVLRLHMKGHRQKYPIACPHCSWSTESQRSLDNHYIRCHLTKLSELLKCKVCKFRTLDPERLRQHVESKSAHRTSRRR